MAKFTDNSPNGFGSKSVAHRRAAAMLAVTIAASICGVVALAGPLDPPPGPITSTTKTNNEVEPRTAINSTNTPGDADSQFKITAGGSYYLTSNLTGVAGKSGIEIALPAGGRVILDLSGFTMQGVAGSLGGLTFGNNPDNLCFLAKNGTIRGWGGNGVANSSNTVAIGLADLAVLLNSGWGVNTPGELTARNCRINRNALGGVRAGVVDLSDLTLLLNGGPAALADGSTLLRSTRIVADGLVNSAPVLSLTGSASIADLSLFLSNSTFTGAALSGNGIVDSGNHRVVVTATGVSATALAENFPVNSISATNCNFSTSVVNITQDGMALGNGEVAISGSTSTPSLVRLAGNNCLLKAGRLPDGSTLLTPRVIVDIVGNANKVLDTEMSSLANGNTMLRAGALANGNTIEACRFVGSGTGSYTGIQLLSSNNLVRGNEAVRLMGGTYIDNQGANNAVGPTVNAANILTNNSPHANIAH
jgi:hypothetical protein